MTRQRPHPLSTRTFLAFFGLLLVLVFPALSGCGSDDTQVIVIDLQPWGLDFSTELDQQSQPQHFMYLVERVFYMSVLRFQRVNGIYNLMASIATPITGGFSPLNVDVATGASDDVMFVTDVIRTGDQIDRTVSPSQLAALPLARGGGSPGPPRPEPRLVGSDLWMHGVSFGAELRW